MAENGINRKAEILVFGGSAGSLVILLNILKQLGPVTSLTIVIVIHRKNSYDSTLLDLLRTKTNMPVREVEDKDALESGNIYLAPADYHLLVEADRTFSLDASEKINFSRPSIDVTFESIADIFGPKAIAVLLSGANSDGTEGIKTIKRKGGTSIVQDPETAQVPFMPQHAIDHAEIDLILKVDEMVEYIRAYD